MRLKAAAGTIAFLLVLVATLQWGIHRRDAWSTEVIDKGIGGDALNYYEMAVSLERDHEVSIGHKPVWARPPGFPIFLWLTTHPLEQDPRAPDEVRMARYIATLRRAQFSVDLVCGLSAVLIALALRAKGFALLAAIVWAVQPWTALIAMHPLSDPLAAAFSGLSFAALAAYLTHRRLHWLAIAAALASAALWVHSSAIALSVPLLLAPLLIEDNWRQRIKALSLASLVWMLVFAPWVVRNDVVFGHPYAFTRGVDGNGQPWDRSAEDAWMRTFDLDEATLYNVAWAIPGRAVWIAAIPESAFDSPAERATVARIFTDYNRRGARLDDDLRARLKAVARDRIRRHPFRCLVELPLRRGYRLLFGPHDGFRMGTVKTLELHGDDYRRLNRSIIGGALLCLLLLWLARRRATALVLFSAIAARLVMLMALPLPEPRYLLPLWPLFIGLFAALPMTIVALLKERPRPHSIELEKEPQ